MNLRSGKIEVTSTLGIDHGMWLQIGTGEEADFVQVRAARGTTVKTGRVYWWHRLLWWLAARPAVIGQSLRRGMCAIAGHRVTRGDFGLRHCWCRRRWEDDADWDDAFEVSFE